MGAVSVDIHKREREYKDLTLSDEEVVKYLLLYRSKVDVAYGANININIYQAGDIFDFNQELIVLYASLDKLIDKIILKEKDKLFLSLVFQGYEVPEIIEHYDYPQKTAYRTLNRIVAKIVDANDEDWYYYAGHEGYITSTTNNR